MAEDAEDAALLVQLVITEGGPRPVLHRKPHCAGGVPICRSSWF
jgi:hypothetical protein